MAWPDMLERSFPVVIQWCTVVIHRCFYVAVGDYTTGASRCDFGCRNFLGESGNCRFLQVQQMGCDILGLKNFAYHKGYSNGQYLVAVGVLVISSFACVMKDGLSELVGCTMGIFQDCVSLKLNFSPNNLPY